MNEYDPQNRHYSQSQSPAWQADDRPMGVQPRTAAEATVSERLGFIRKVYALFFVGILFAVGGVVIGFNTPSLMMAIASSPWITLIALIAAVIGAQAVRHVPGVNIAAFFGFTIFTGVVISPLLYYVSATNPASILQAGVLTVGIFGGLTAYVFISKKDFSFMRGHALGRFDSSRAGRAFERAHRRIKCPRFRISRRSLDSLFGLCAL